MAARLLAAAVWLWAVAGVGFGGPAAAAVEPPTALARSVTVSAEGAVTRVTIEFDRPVRARSFQLPAPAARFVIDLAGARIGLDAGRPAGRGPGGGVVAQYRYAAQPNGGARLVLDLAGPVRVVRAPGPAAGARLVFDLAPTGAAAAAPAPAVIEPVAAVRAPTPPLPALAELRTDRRARRTIVIDAGHGGRDPGAIGPSGVREKDVVLDSALRLREALEARGRYHVVLSRDGDAFLPLEERVRIARAHQADLFISLHADSAPNAAAQGASLYTLSERGGDRARRLMDRQDWDLDLGEAPRTGVVGDILIDLAQRETTNRSAAFAETVIGTFNGQVPLLRNTHRNAGFFVLLAPDVPAVLIELGFLTNPEDERRLADPRARRRTMALLADAVDAYFGREPPLLLAGR